MTIQSTRLLLRLWEEDDLPWLTKLNANEEVMRYFPAPLSSEQSEACFRRWNASYEENGFAFWCACFRESGERVGIIGLGRVDYEELPAPGVEVGWRLHPQFWKQGLATEGALASLAYLFSTEVNEVMSMTTTVNQPSRAVMERLGMHHDPKEDFVHPKVPPDWEDRLHVLYRLKSEEFVDKHGACDRHFELAKSQRRK